MGVAVRAGTSVLTTTFPASPIGAAGVDRGPGAAGDLGQENYGGAIHFFSPDVSDALRRV